MVAVETKVVIRLLTQDHPEQFLALALFGSEEIWISKTVFLEAEWVLRTHYYRRRYGLRAWAG